jgi:phosphoribosylamine--glycine ligase
VPHSKRVLVVGSGGREHAIAWKLASDGAEVLVAPGNAGTAAVGRNLPVAADDIPGLLDAVEKHDVDLTIVGPELPLVGGIVDAFHERKLRIFGPTADAARLEGSKAFCKKILNRGDVPTAAYREFRRPAEAREYLLAREETPLVVKADGLAAGKGVFVCSSRDDALAAVDALSEIGGPMLIEERLDGVEVSVMAITDGRTIVTLPPLQDHKAAHDGDQGPNTGGMGAYCPAPFVDATMLAEIEEQILVPTIHAMKRGRTPFQGLLYAGLMLTPQGPKVLEFNVRFGDPECQPLMVLLSSSLLELLDATVDGRLEDVAPPTWREEAAVTVVMAAEGYPGPASSGHPIRGLDAAARIVGVHVFHAGTATAADGQIVTAGGRVLSVTATAPTLPQAKLQAYTGVREIRWLGGWCRKDIADKGILRERQLAAEAEPEEVGRG